MLRPVTAAAEYDIVLTPTLAMVPQPVSRVWRATKNGY
jgi:hypothetical protein